MTRRLIPDIDAYLPETYVASEEQRLDLYKRIALIDSEEGRDEMLDELIDRFGEPSRSVQNLLFIAMLRMEAHKAFVTDIVQRPEEIVLPYLNARRSMPAGSRQSLRRINLM